MEIIIIALNASGLDRALFQMNIYLIAAQRARIWGNYALNQPILRPKVSLRVYRLKDLNKFYYIK